MMRQFYFLPDKTGGFIKKLWLFACFLLFSWGANAQCPTGNVILTSQTQVNTFGTNYPNCTEITGYLYISGSNITDLSPLSNIQSIGGYLQISSNSQLTNLDGLSNLTEIGGYLFFYYNSQLTNLDGLSNLTEIGGYLNIQSNSQLTNLDGLSNLTQIGGYLDIKSNSQLTNLDGLSNLTQIGGYLDIFYNSQLTNLDGLSNLTQIGGYLYIQSNSQLTNLDGLSALESINGDLVIYNNAVLTDISGLQNIDPATILPNSYGLHIQNNPLLSVCNLDNFCTYLAGSGARTISNNAGDCVSVTAVTTACTTSQEPQCPTGGVELYSQADVNNFATNYPNCTEITGFLYISESTITDLSPLSNIQSVGGLLEISYNSQLTNLDGLSNLTQIGGDLNIVSNSQLTNLYGLSNLTSVGGYLNIYDNLSLTNLDGLNNLTSVGGFLLIDSNSNLTNLDGLSNLTSVGGNLDIYSNLSLTNLDGLNNLTSVGGYLSIANNSSLTNLDGLNNLTSVGGYLNIYNNLSLTNLDGLNNLTSAGGNLNINYNSNLTNLDGLSNLTSVGGNLNINSNSNLTNLDGLSNLTSVGGYLVINSNYSLTDISGLQNIDPASILSTNGLGLYITNNSSLSVCNMDNFCTYLAGSGLRTISGNAGDCVSVTAVTTACTTSQEPQCPTGDVILYSQADVNNFATNYPNCTEITGYLSISGSDITDLSPLSNIQSIGGYLYIQANSQLTNLDGLSNLTQIGGFLYIQSNSQLTNLDGLSALESINGYLRVQNNAVLTDISGLQNIDPATILPNNYGLYIRNNPLLSVCNLDNFCAYLAGSGARTISQNAGDCVSVTAVTTACTTSQEPQCPTGDVTLYSQADVNNFATNYPNCTEITGYLYISGSNITDLSPLSNIQSVGGYLEISYNSQLTNLDGLSNLTQIGGYLNIYNNSQLTNLDGLSNLTQIGGVLYIQTNAILENLDGLIALESINGALVIYDNPVLTDISGLQNIDPATILPNSLGLYIQYNSLLSVCNLDNFCTYLAGSGPRTISGNAGNCYESAVTTACTTSSEPQCPTGAVGLYSQADVNNFATNYPNCTEITGNLQISGSTITDLSPLSNIQSIGGYLDIYYNSQLTNLDGLSNLTQIGGNLVIESNSQLTNLDGLSALESINGDLLIIDNAVLTDISGLQNIDPATILPTLNLGLYIIGNPLLSVCNLDNFCTYLAGSGPRNISGNAGDCVSVTAVTTACTTSQEPQCPTGDVILTSQTQVNDFGTNYPNCTEITGNLQISGSDITDLSPLSNIQSVGGYLYAEHSSQLTSLQGLHNVASVGGSLSIYNNPQLNSVQALSNITSLGGFLSIYNTNLSSLEGLHNITAIDGGLSITSNAVLTDISALENIDPETITGTGLYIAGNSSLSVCDLDNFCTFLQGSGTRTISGNAGNCYESAVTNACLGIISYCTPISDSTSVNYGIYISSFTTTEGITNINNTNSGVSANGYGNFSAAYSASQNAGESLSFSAVPGTESYQKGLRIWVDWNNDGVFDNTDGNPEIVYVSPSVLAGTHNGSFTIPGNKPAGNYRMRVMMKYNTSSLIDPCEINYGAPYYSYFYGETEDYTLTVLEPLPCSSPAALTASNLTMQSATINWTSTGSLFEIEWGVEGFVLGNGTTDTTSATSYDLSGLEVDTSYDFYVRQDCNASSDGYSNWTKYTFTIGYCIPVPLSNSGGYGININSFTTTGGETNINNTNSGFSTGGYGNFSAAYSASQNAGESLSFSAVPGTESYQKGLRIWVDWNNDGVFDNTDGNPEIVYVSPSVLYGTHNGSFTIPNDKPAGNYRMRVMMKYESTTIDPCEITNGTPYYNYFYGETEDYTLTVLADLSGNCESYTIWNGTQWSNGTPDANKKAIIEGNLTLTGNMTACELLLNSGVLTINSNAVLTVNGQIVNTQSEANFIVQSDANLIQVEDVENDGAITVQRNTTIKHLDYTIWSSPVAGQDLQAFSPYTLPNRILVYNGAPTVNTWLITTGDFEAGKGYMFRAPNVFDDGNYPNAYSWTGNFIGVANNGSIDTEFASIGKFQSLGNPYPSNLDRQAFHDENPNLGALYFWTNTFAADANGNYAGNNWKVVNTLGDTVATDVPSMDPIHIISVGQGFLARVYNDTPEANFNNSMRTSQSGTFYRANEVESHKYWLNLSNQNSTLNQILVSYNTSSTNELDFGIDSELYNYTGSALYSLIENSQDKFAIQGRSLPFQQTDIVPLGFRATQAGNYTVSLSNFEGVFAEGQEIYLRDKLTQVEHNLKLEAYAFVSEQGTFNERFEVIYTTQSLNIENPNLENSWIVYKDDNSFNILTQGFEIKDVVVYDMLGRVVYKANEVNTNSHNFSTSSTNQVLIVKIITENQQELVKKVIR